MLAFANTWVLDLSVTPHGVLCGWALRWVGREQAWGNRILSLVSTFLYAVLTSRALLVGPSEVLAQIICNPFEETGATWMTSSSGFRSLLQSPSGALTFQFLLSPSACSHLGSLEARHGAPHSLRAQGLGVPQTILSCFSGVLAQEPPLGNTLRRDIVW